MAHTRVGIVSLRRGLSTRYGGHRRGFLRAIAMSRIAHTVAGVAVMVASMALPPSIAQAAVLPLPAGNTMYFVAHSANDLSQVTGESGGTLTTSAICSSSCGGGVGQNSGAFVDVSTNDIYFSGGAGSGANRFSLYRVPVTGASAGVATLVGTDGLDYVFGMAQGPDGAFGIGNQLYSIDLATGSLTGIGSWNGPSGSTWNGFAYDRTSNRYFAMSRGSGDLYVVNVTTGTVTLIGSVTGVSGSYSLQVDGDGVLWNLSPSGVLTSFTVTGNTIGAPVVQGSFASFTTTALVINAPLAAARTPTFDSPVSTAAGFTVNVTNWDAAWSWNPSVSSGSVTAGTPTGSTLPLTVTGLGASSSATVTVSSARPGYVTGTATVTGSASPAPPPPPPVVLSMSPSHQDISGTVGTPITTTSKFTLSGFTLPVSYSVYPALPVGLRLDPVTGVVSGTPSEAYPSTRHWITAATAGGAESASSTLGLTVVEPPLPPPIPDPEPLPAPLPPGGSSLVVDGQPSPGLSVDPNPSSDGLDITGPGFSMTLAALGLSGSPLPLSDDSSLQVEPGQRLVTSGTGFAPDSPVAVYLNPPQPVAATWAALLGRALGQAGAKAVPLGTLKVDEQGAFIGDLPLPVNLALGPHVVQAVGYTPTGQTRAVSIGVQAISPERRSILIAGTRDGNRVRARGVTSHIDSTTVTPRYHFAGQVKYKTGTARPTIDTSGKFTWSRKTGRTIYLYFAADKTRSNRLVIPAKQ